MNLQQLKESHCNVSPLFKAQDSSLVLRLSGSKVFEEPVQIFYANLHSSKDSGELETLMLDTRIILNVFCLKRCLTVNSLE